VKRFEGAIHSADGLRDLLILWLKELEKENQRLRRAVSDLTLDKLILTEATKRNV